ncbi:acetamidase/formamidase family protein [Ancylobacter sp. 6x-1]|uniref:Acetamidase/formamidase family protein n=1 Tax=Ancylobacter crimeensis TaxID=2579147 RepID=A0ABT0DEY1_9HYPH|nr:acetamidase/formamidase family protein [Ancylobacter crimeensis]MCK0198526.1 acetamidase/formamidase family protein [Ancylobacter crimeensis]
MTLQPFSSESYSEDVRPAAWLELLGGFGLAAGQPRGGMPIHATALSRLSSVGVRFGRLAAGPQTIAASPQRADLPLLLVPLDGGAALRTCEEQQILSAGQAVLLPREGDWQITFAREMRILALSVPGDAFLGRKVAPFSLRSPRTFGPDGLAGILTRTLQASADTLDRLPDGEWESLARSLAEWLLSLVTEAAATSADTSASKAALLQRIYRTIEARLTQEDISVADIARSEGISERYLQKVLGEGGDNFSHYVRERRLQRAWHDLANPAEAAVPISDVAYRYGFADSAHFSRLFRERFGMPPREFRRRESEIHAVAPAASGQRGWPQEALAQLRARQGKPGQSKPGQSPSAARRHAGPPVDSPADEPSRHHLAAHAGSVHWGYFSRSLAPVMAIGSGDVVTVETLTQHASDDPERMIAGDAGAESVFHWTATEKSVERRGAGPLDASIYGRGAGEGFGVHICTGPIAVRGAQPGDVLEVRILDIAPRPSQNPAFRGRVFGSSVAAWWGYHYSEFLTEPKPRETVTIYEIVADAEEPYAEAVHAYRWEPQTDPYGVRHQTYDYPGVKVAPGSVTRRIPTLDGIRIPLRLHFGVIAVAPREAELVDSVPPAYFGGNLDNWRLGKDAAVYLPVSVPGALLSIGDPHAAQGDGELSGTAIECSMTGTFRVVLHRKAELAATGMGALLGDLTYPLIETPEEWVLTGFSHPNYLAEFGAHGQSEVYAKSSLDLAMKDAFRKVRRFLMTTKGLTEDEAIALMSAAVDFGITQVVDGNWGVHAIVRKRLFGDGGLDGGR